MESEYWKLFFLCTCKCLRRAFEEFTKHGWQVTGNTFFASSRGNRRKPPNAKDLGSETPSKHSNKSAATSRTKYARPRSKSMARGSALIRNDHESVPTDVIIPHPTPPIRITKCAEVFGLSSMNQVVGFVRRWGIFQMYLHSLCCQESQNPLIKRCQKIDLFQHLI